MEEHICDNCVDEVYGDLGHPEEFLNEVMDMLVDGYFCDLEPLPLELLRWTDDLDKLIGSRGFRNAINRETLKYLRARVYREPSHREVAEDAEAIKKEAVSATST